MKLLTQEIIKKLPPLRSGADAPELPTKAVCKFFTPWTNWTWYVTEGSNDAENADPGDWMFFGRTDGHECEWGYFSLAQLEEIKGPFGLRVERDRNFNGNIPPATRG